MPATVGEVGEMILAINKARNWAVAHAPGPADPEYPQWLEVEAALDKIDTLRDYLKAIRVGFGV